MLNFLKPGYFVYLLEMDNPVLPAGVVHPIRQTPTLCLGSYGGERLLVGEVPL